MIFFRFFVLRPFRAYVIYYGRDSDQGNSSRRVYIVLRVIIYYITILYLYKRREHARVHVVDAPSSIVNQSCFVVAPAGDAFSRRMRREYIIIIISHNSHCKHSSVNRVFFALSLITRFTATVFLGRYSSGSSRIVVCHILNPSRSSVSFQKNIKKQTIKTQVRGGNLGTAI